jgi:broad specificity phosphatase PhoE
MQLILVRHGESVGNSENRLQGHNDYDLTDLGRSQAALTAERLHELGTSAVYTSPLLRAGATAGAISKRLDIEPQVLPGVSEYIFGELSGATYAELRERFANDPKMAAIPAAERVYPGEEGRQVFFERVTASVWKVIDSHPGETVAVVSHGGPIALFCQYVLGLPYKRPMPFAINNCSLTTVRVSEDTSLSHEARARLVQLNDTCHLDEDRPRRDSVVEGDQA